MRGLLVLPTAEYDVCLRRIILTGAMPRKERFVDDTGCGHQGTLLLEVEAIHLGRKVALPAIELDHVLGLRWIQKYVAVRPIELRQLCHTNSHLGQARAGFRQKTIRRKPWSVGALLHVFAESDVNGVVVLGDIPVDVVQAATTYLHVDLALEY